jgi:phosphatidylglycerol---prolipoprotein diacylglyceryl transferase
MVPYIHVPDLHIGPLPLHPFGLLVATGVLVGTSVTTKRAEKLGYDLVQLNSFVTWMLVTAFILSHVLDELFYHWEEVVARPLSLVMFWQGLSSFGGFFGAVVGIVLWKYFVVDRNRLRWRPKPMPLLPFADLVLSVLPLGWMFGRTGCATVHDHPGARAAADTLLAVAYPACYPCRVSQGMLTDLRPDETVSRLGFIEFIHGHEPRFDLGFLELLFTIVLAASFAITWRRKLPTGTYVIATALAYAPVRFVMDFLRVPDTLGGDTRYAGLTPAQYGCIALFVFGVAMIPYVRRLAASGVDAGRLLRARPPGGKPPQEQAVA